MTNNFKTLRQLNQRWLAMSLRWLLLCAVAGMLFFTMKGIGETLTPWSQATVSLLANLYYPEDGRDQVTVLRFREQDLTSLGKEDQQTGKKTRIPFPVPYEVHIETLKALANWAPKALLIDFAFIDKRKGDDVEALLETLCDLHDHDTRVYLASFYYWQPNHGLRDDLFVDSRGNARRSCFTVVPVNYRPESNGLAQTYELIQGPSGQRQTDSAALRMYADATSVAPEKFSDPMDILWGSLPPRPQRSDTPCSPVNLAESAIRLAKEGPRALERDCPYSNTLSVFSLWNETSDDIRALLTGKFVLYGAGFVGTDDWLKSPVHGNIPGVYLHAMALDNLLVFGDRYKRMGEHGMGGKASSVLIADILIICLGVLWHLLVVNFHNKRTIGEQTATKRKSVAIKTNPDLFRFLLFSLPYLLLSAVATGGLWLTGTPGWGVTQLGIVLLLLIAGAWTLLTNRRLKLPDWLNNVFSWLRDRFIDSSWIALMAVMCGIIFYYWNLGPRNFWAFAAFLGFTHLIDRRLATAAGHIRRNRLREARRKHFRLFWSLTLSVGLVMAALLTDFLVSLKIDALQAVVLAGLVVLLLIAFALILFNLLPWLYRDDIEKSDIQRRK